MSNAEQPWWRAEPPAGPPAAQPAGPVADPGPPRPVAEVPRRAISLYPQTPRRPAPPRRRRGAATRIAVLLTALAMLAGASGVRALLPRTIEGVALPAGAAQDPAAGEQSGGASAPTTTPPPPRPQPIYLLADHPLLGGGVTLPDVTCDLPAFRRDQASLDAYYRAFAGCMNATWEPVLEAHNLPYRPPEINVAVHPGKTGCGDPDTDPGLGEFTAMYCPADQTLYLPTDRIKKVDRGRASGHLAVVAHEYAHHIQQLSGLLWAAAEATDKAGDGTPAGNAFVRRSELEANCFAGLLLAAAAGRGDISKGLAGQAVAEFRNGALPQTHGTAAHQAAWAKKGYDKRTTVSCNTWSAPPSEVS